MTARLRVLPVYNGERGQHYLVLDRANWPVDRVQHALESVKGHLREVGGTLLVFADEVDLPGGDLHEGF